MNFNRILTQTTNSELGKKCINKDSVTEFFKAAMELIFNRNPNNEKIKNVLSKFKILLEKNQNSLECLMDDKKFGDQMCKFLTSNQVSRFFKNNLLLSAINNNPNEFKSIFIISK